MSADHEVVELGERVDAQAWDAEVLAGSGNPTQLAAFGTLGGRLRRPVFARVWRGGALVLQWLFYVVGPFRGAVYLDIRSEPSRDDSRAVQAALAAASRRFLPFRIVLHDMVCNRWRSDETLRGLGFDRIQAHGTIALDLTRGSDSLWADLPKSRRRAIRRAEREGVVIEEQSDAAGAERAYPLIVDTLERGGGHVPRLEHVRGHAAALCRTGNARLFFATCDGADQGVIIDLVTPSMALGWLGGTRRDAPRGTGHLLQWRVIETMAADAVQAYDLGAVDTQAEPGSKGARILDNKRRYGGRLSHHYGGSWTTGAIRAGVYDRLLGLYRRWR